jgi:Carboxypeptidase regulatory-like domain
MTRIVAILLATFLSAAGCAQTPQGKKSRTENYVVEGRVTDWVTGTGILAATVAATDSHKKTYQTLTTGDGSYRLEHLPPEARLNLACSQLGYSPNPQQSVIDLKNGLGKWDIRLFEEGGGAAYLKGAAAHLSTLTGPEALIEAEFVADNVDANSKKIIAEHLRKPLLRCLTQGRSPSRRSNKLSKKLPMGTSKLSGKRRNANSS